MMSNRLYCLVNSFARVLHTTPAILLEEIGHDGKEVIWPDLPPPFNYACFHVSELIDCALRRNFAVTMIELFPASRNPANGSLYQLKPNHERFLNHLENGNGVLMGFYEATSPHAVAWIDRQIINNGRVYEGLGGFNPRIFLRVDRIAN